MSAGLGQRRDFWFVGDMKKELCNKLVLSGPHGTFLVRQSTAGDRYVLAINDNGKTAPYQIKIVNGKFYWRQTTFDNLDAVIQDVFANPFDGPSGLPLILKDPASGGTLHPSSVPRLRAEADKAGGAAPVASTSPAPPQQATAAPAKKPDDVDYVLYQALYDYKNDDPEDLDFDANDILQVTDEGDPPGTGWMEGRTQDGRFGAFPSTYVRKIRMANKKVQIDSYG